MIAVYPGSFDPVTSGHMDIVQRAAALYESLIVLIGVNSAKTPVFTADERMSLLTRAIEAAALKNVTVACFSDALLVDYAEGLGRARHRKRLAGRIWTSNTSSKWRSLNVI